MTTNSKSVMQNPEVNGFNPLSFLYEHEPRPGINTMCTDDLSIAIGAADKFDPEEGVGILSFNVFGDVTLKLEINLENGLIDEYTITATNGEVHNVTTNRYWYDDKNRLVKSVCCWENKPDSLERPAMYGQRSVYYYYKDDGNYIEIFR